MPAGDTRQGPRGDLSEVPGVGLPAGTLREPVEAALGRARGAVGPELARAAGTGGDPSSEFPEAVAGTTLLEAAESAQGRVHSLTNPANGRADEARLWGMAGGWLRSRAAELAADLGPQQLELTCRALSEIAEGWMHEARDLYDAGRTLERYLVAVNGTRGALGALAASLGGSQGGLDQEPLHRLAGTARGLATAARLRDHLLDLTPSDSPEQHEGHGLAQGVYTLPVILSIERDPELARSLGGAVARADLVALVDRIWAAGGPLEASARCRELVEDALSALTEIDATQTLAAIGAQIVEDCESAVTR